MHLIETKTYDSGKVGQKVLVSGAVHGNEPCGPCAIDKITHALEKSEISLVSGSVTFVSICNPKAFENNTRYFDEDLNRAFVKTDKPNTYEQEIANELCTLIDECDVFLDIHSMSADGPPTAFLDFPTKDNLDFSRQLGASCVLVGWPELYEEKVDEIISNDSTAYAHKQGKIAGFIECGKHDKLASCNVAYKAIYNTLLYFDLVEGDKLESIKPIEVRMKEVFIRRNKGDKFVKDWKHLDAVKSGETLAEYKSGEFVVSPSEGFVVMPNKDAKVGEEWFYLGVETQS